MSFGPEMRTRDTGRHLAAIRDAAQDAITMARLARDLPAFLRTNPTAEDARTAITARLATRTARFLANADRLIYARPASPLRALLSHAGCERGDLHALVRAEGLEGALRVLCDRGVYVTYDEFKGRRVAVRGSRQFQFRPTQFANPRVRPHISRYTSGTGGRPNRVDLALPYVVEQAWSIAALYDAHQLGDRPYVVWAPAPIANFLICARIGMPIDRWYIPFARLPMRVRFGIATLRAIGAINGWHVPCPTYLDPATPGRMVDILRQASAAGSPPVFKAVVSTAARVAVAAVQAGVRLDGVTTLVDSEPITPHRRALLEEAGMSVIVGYGSVETPTLAYSCAAPSAPDDVHVFADRYAVITRRRPVSETGPEVDALMVTTLSESAPVVALNVETGDDATVSERSPSCCGLGALGLTTHLTYIRSFEKLTGEGATFARSALVTVLEEVLPARFGGTGLDYQIAEVQAGDGTTRLVLRVDPCVGPVDEAELKAVVLASIERDGIVARFHAELWRQAGTLEVVRERPRATAAGKIFPIQIERSDR